jgi:FKBP-type peptidyl-prolyl cis-trans isomerase FklB
MKIKLLLVVFSLLALVSCSNYSGKGAAGSGSGSLKSDLDSVSYGLGVDVATSIMRGGVDELNVAAFAEAMNKVLNNDTADLKIKFDDIRPLIAAYFTKAIEVKNEKNKKAGEEFLAENLKKEGVKTTESGVQYIILQEGKGQIPNDTSTIKFHYKGTLINGEVFESSYDQGQPIEVPVNRLIQGWQDALRIMPVGSKWKLFIPQELGYGANVRPGGKIEPYMALIFEMELLEIIEPKTEK